MGNKNLRRLDCRVTAQTAYHLNNLRKICGYKDVGMVVDRLVREKMLSMKRAAVPPENKKGD